MLNLEMDRRTTAEQAADAIRTGILSGNIKDGDEIIQEQVANNLGLSRMPVREALKQLENEGLIERMDNRHTRAIGVTPQTRKTRLDILCALTGIAIARIPPERLKEALGDIGAGACEKAQFAFHGRVFQKTDDRFARQLYFGVFSGFLNACLKMADKLPDAELLYKAAVGGGEAAALKRYYDELNEAVNGSDDR